MKSIELNGQDVVDLATALELWIKDARDDLDDPYFADTTARMEKLIERLPTF